MALGVTHMHDSTSYHYYYSLSLHKSHTKIISSNVCCADDDHCFNHKVALIYTNMSEEKSLGVTIESMQSIKITLIVLCSLIYCMCNLIIKEYGRIYEK